MNVLLFGATGTAGSGILRACVASPEVKEIRAVARHKLQATDPKLAVFVHDDFQNFAKVHQAFIGVDACFYALGKSVSQVDGEAEYRRLTHDFAMAAATLLAAESPTATLHFVSGQGTSLKSRFMWARVKAETERDLAKIATTVCWRPGFIDGGDVNRGPGHYNLLRPLLRLLKNVRRLYVTSEDIGLAMIQATHDRVRSGIVENARIRDLADRARNPHRAG